MFRILLALFFLLPAFARAQGLPDQILPEDVDTGPLAADSRFDYTEPDVTPQPILPGPTRLVMCSEGPPPKVRMLFARYIDIEMRLHWETDEVNLLKVHDVMPDGIVLLTGVRERNGRQRIWLGVAGGRAPLEVVLKPPESYAEYNVLLTVHRDGGYVAVIQKKNDRAAWRIDLDRRLRSSKWVRLDLPASALITSIWTDLHGKLWTFGDIKGDSEMDFRALFDKRGKRSKWETAPPDGSIFPNPPAYRPKPAKPPASVARRKSSNTLIWRAPNERTNPYPWQVTTAEEFFDGRLGPVIGFVLPEHGFTVHGGTVGSGAREADALITEPQHLRQGFIAVQLVGDYSRALFYHNGVWLFLPELGRCRRIFDDQSLGVDTPDITHYDTLPNGDILLSGIAGVGGPRFEKFNRLVWVGRIAASDL